MTDPMVRTQVYLPRDVYDALRARAEAQNSTMAVQIREALESYLDRAERAETGRVLRADDPLFALAGVAEGPDDLAREHDQYLYAQPAPATRAPAREKTPAHSAPRKRKRKRKSK